MCFIDWKTARLRSSAKRAIEQEKPAEAALDAAAALQIRPGDHELTRLLSDAYDATNDERLLNVLSQEISQTPETLDPRIRLAQALSEVGRRGGKPKGYFREAQAAVAAGQGGATLERNTRGLAGGHMRDFFVAPAPAAGDM